MKVTLSNTARKLCIIGDPVLHSKSPLLQNAMCQALGLDYIYLCQTVSPAGLPAFLDAAKTLGYAGFNATMPLKTALLPYLDSLDPLAEKIGAVNTVCIKNGKLYGYNTDSPGFLAALREAGIEPAGRRVLLLGAGGAATAVAVGLLDAGVAHLTVANRTPARAQHIATLAPARTSAVSLDPRALAREAAEAELLVNATSLGMGGQGEFEDLSFLEALPQGTPVSDLIYHPAQTKLLARAKALGHPTMNGLPLLMHQAILALERFADVSISPRQVTPLLEELLKGEA